MKQLTAVFKVENRTFVELSEPIVKMANIKPGQLLSPELAPNGDILLRIAEEGDDGLFEGKQPTRPAIGKLKGRAGYTEDRDNARI
jgi:hypothetical protein